MPAPTAVPPRRRALLLGVAALALVADLVSKVLVVAELDGEPPVRLLGGLLVLTHSRNPGAAFSIGTNATVLFTAVAAVVVAVIIRLSGRVRSTPWALGLGLLLGGAAGNLVDRVLRDPGPLRGAVVDWIRVPNWPTFNLADSAIVVGGLLCALLSVRGLGLDGSREETGGAGDPEAVGPDPSGRRPSGG